MRSRPRTTKRAKKKKILRCPKCNKVVRLYQARCKTCHLVLPKLV
ncbi:MAG: hypothetical protein KatS3mg105_1488 [Gemmatales bacterium]|nr:MAG: hypothetical protein KatS3mg105_1488 [Gemmatales bacterium]